MLLAEVMLEAKVSCLVLKGHGFSEPDRQRATTSVDIHLHFKDGIAAKVRRGKAHRVERVERKEVVRALHLNGPLARADAGSVAAHPAPGAVANGSCEPCMHDEWAYRICVLRQMHVQS
eukprot:CAMPEP_0119470140 /NCGR_PEP_ID=MMETSP1344-20130328/3170_1 /TAXON_ID=236787 /ORGANISM="Florenciella parvula, Strain CCMP2471" /LENGTH=118 /DNA_ID=CAMNT_0007502779 /DNA_START=467 /DNA_END=823 /DNA_ORIENTATION=+